MTRHLNKKEDENMSTVIICIVIAAICVYAVISYKKKLANGCCGGGDAVAKVKPKNSDKSHYEHKTIISIGGMSCQNCAVRVENAFNSRDGFYAKVNLHKKSAELLSENIVDEDEIREIIGKCGYTVTGIEIKK